MAHTPLLEIIERPPSWTGETEYKMYQIYKGQLELSIYINAGILTIHVIQARDLVAKKPGDMKPYVKVSMLPECKKKAARTNILRNTSGAPYWDEKFSFKVSGSDVDKRCLVSVWDKSGRFKSDLIGCMSFGLHYSGSDRKIASGWYFLLTDLVGKRKHLQVTSLSPKSDSSLEYFDVSHTSRLHHGNPRKNMWEEHHVVRVRCENYGYGFTLGGSSPAYIASIRPGSTAEGAGARVGDQLLTVNGLRVIGCTADSIAHLIRHSKSGQQILGIRRYRQIPHTTSQLLWQPERRKQPCYHSNSSSYSEGSEDGSEL